jgi:hypothetical protein
MADAKQAVQLLISPSRHMSAGTGLQIADSALQQMRNLFPRTTGRICEAFYPAIGIRSGTVDRSARFIYYQP